MSTSLLKIWLHLTDINGNPVVLRSDHIAGYFAHLDGKHSVVMVYTQLTKLRHPVTWKDEEIETVCRLVRETEVLPCPVDGKGKVLVDAIVEQHEFQIIVKDSISEIAQQMRALQPHQAVMIEAPSLEDIVKRVVFKIFTEMSKEVGK